MILSMIFLWWPSDLTYQLVDSTRWWFNPYSRSKTAVFLFRFTILTSCLSLFCFLFFFSGYCTSSTPMGFTSHDISPFWNAKQIAYYLYHFWENCLKCLWLQCCCPDIKHCDVRFNYVNCPSFWRSMRARQIQSPAKFEERQFHACAKLFGTVWGTTIPFISSQCRGFEPSNFAILLVFLKLKTRSQYFPETGPCACLFWLTFQLTTLCYQILLVVEAKCKTAIVPL